MTRRIGLGIGKLLRRERRAKPAVAEALALATALGVELDAFDPGCAVTIHGPGATA